LRSPGTCKEARLTELKKAYRGWQIKLMPGYKAHGKLQYAHFCWKKNGRYYNWLFDYGQCDNHVPQDNIFAEALERLGPDLTRELWLKHYDNCSPHASLSLGGWKWWSARGVPLAFIEDITALLKRRYALARKLYESWSINLDDFDSLGIPPGRSCSTSSS
jgi:hypothetical protein